MADSMPEPVADRIRDALRAPCVPLLCDLADSSVQWATDEDTVQPCPDHPDLVRIGAEYLRIGSQIAVGDIVERGDRIIACLTVLAAGSDRLPYPLYQVFTLRDNRIVAVHGFRDARIALDGIGGGNRTLGPRF